MPNSRSQKEFKYENKLFIDHIEKLIEQITSQNKSALANTLSSVGQDYINYSLIKNNPAFLYSPILQNLKQPNKE